MKTFIVLSAIMALLVIIGCGEEVNEEANQPGQYQGFQELQGGEWAEYTTLEGEKMKYEYLGVDTIDNHQCFIIELEIESESEKIISQIWVDKASGENVIYVIKQAGIVIKMDISQIPTSSTDFFEGASGTTPPEYTPGNETSVEEYETPTGKKIRAAIFQVNSDETWVSEEVPFGIVKIISKGQTTLQLYDFSFSGAEKDISKAEIEKSPDIPSFP